MYRPMISFSKYLLVLLRINFQDLIINAALEEVDLKDKLLNGFEIGVFYSFPETKHWTLQ
jgi:hypothetical protein